MRETNNPSCFKLDGVLCFDLNCRLRNQCKPSTGSIPEQTMSDKHRADLLAEAEHRFLHGCKTCGFKGILPKKKHEKGEKSE